jgi:NAD(P)-dependent dehydrogenase (short-subunit alcohol dehydrogenase family)
MSRFEGRSVVVIGGTHGMGLATAKALADGGAEVLLTGRNEANVARAGEALAGRAAAMRSDVSSLADIEALAGTVEETLGAIDALFVFAGDRRVRAGRARSRRNASTRSSPSTRRAPSSPCSAWHPS